MIVDPSWEMHLQKESKSGFGKRPTVKTQLIPWGAQRLEMIFIDIPDDNKRSWPLHIHIFWPLQGLWSGIEQVGTIGQGIFLWLMGHERFKASNTYAPSGGLTVSPEDRRWISMCRVSGTQNAWKQKCSLHKSREQCKLHRLNLFSTPIQKSKLQKCYKICNFEHHLTTCIPTHLSECLITFSFWETHFQILFLMKCQDTLKLIKFIHSLLIYTYMCTYILHAY